MNQQREIDRRSVLKGLLLAGAGLAVGCAPTRIVLGLYSDDFENDAGLTEDFLVAFISTVVPGIDPSTPDLTRQFHDDYYPFAAHRNFFLYDLRKRSEKVAGTPDFPSLSYDQRERVIQDGLEAGGVTRRLYTGAVFLTQIATYAGIYDEDRGCELIGFEGRNRGFRRSTLTYPDRDRFLAEGITGNGNYA